MVKRKLFKFSLPAILLAALVAGIALFAPVILNKDPHDLTVSLTATPRSIFIGDIFTLNLDVRYPKDRIIVKPGEIQVVFEPFELVNKPKIEEKPGEIIISYELRCLENTACAGNKTYRLPSIIIYYTDNLTGKIEKTLLRVEPIFISAQIDPATKDLQIRYPQEPVVENNLGFFAVIILSGILLIVLGLLGLYRTFFGSKKKTKYSQEDIDEYNSNRFLRRLEELRSMLLRDANPRLVFAQSAGLIEDYLDASDQEEISSDSRNELVVLKRDSEDRAYQENKQNEPTIEEAAARVGEISLILSQKDGGQS